MTTTGKRTPRRAASPEARRAGSPAPGCERACDEIVDLLPVGVIQVDAQGTVVRVNRTLAELLGGPIGPGQSTTLPDLGWQVAGGDGKAALARLVASADGPGTQGELLELRNVDGRQLWVRARANRVGGAGGGCVVVVSDVTAEHQLQQLAEEERERYRLLADHVGDVVLVLRESRVVWASPSVEPVLAVGPETLVGRELADLAHPDDVRDRPGLTPQSPVQRYRLRLRHPDGADGWRWFAATITARWQGDTAVETYASLRDIEEQVIIEQAAGHTERRLRLVFDASSDGYAVYEARRDENGAVTGVTLLSVNAAGLATLGKSELEVIGTDVRRLFPEPVSSSIYEEMLVGLGGAGQVRSRHLLDMGSGERVYDGALTLLDPDLLLSTWRDVTDAVEGERLLERAYEETAEMRATLQTALDATSDGFAVYSLEWDDDGMLTGLRVVHANAAGAMSLGLDPTDMIDMELHDFLPEVEAMGLWDRIADAAVTKAPQHIRIHVFSDSEAGPGVGRGDWESSWDYSVAPVGEERMAITWRDVSAEESALRQLARHRDEAMHSATHDALTGLPNRTLLLDHLRAAVRTCRPDQRIGIVFVDLDRFKAINDTYGHAAGDAVLRVTAERLGKLVRHGDLAARLAGDEFVLVLTQLNPDWTSEQFFSRASALLAEPMTAEGVVLHPSASLGVVLADPADGRVDVDALIKRADAAMYEAKAAGRRGVPSPR